jgi:hypothetical protein
MTNERAELPARTHSQAAELFRRRFAPGAIGFRAMMKVPLNGDRSAAPVAAYLGAHGGDPVARCWRPVARAHSGPGLRRIPRDRDWHDQHNGHYQRVPPAPR